ncbi:MAG: FliG C-terminal domain-containing protein [Buchnera aphidicola (Floraphis choui)]
MMILDGVTKSAILLIAVGVNKATEILKELSFSEIQDLIKCMLNLRQVSCTIVDQVISEFNDNFSIDNSTSIVDKNYVITLSKKVLGEKNAEILLNKIKDNEKIICGIKQLNLVDPKVIANLIKCEHAQIIASILVYLNRNQSAEILSYLEEKLSLDVISRIAEFTGLEKSGENELIKIINYLLENKEKVIFNENGVTTIIELLKLMEYDQEKRIINGIEVFNKELANIIKSKIFVFEDIINLDDACIRRLIQETTLDELSIAISRSSELLKEKILKNMSKKNADYLQNFFIKNSSISIDVIKEKQNNLLNIIKKF